MFMERPVSVIKNRVLRPKVGCIGIQPYVDALRLDWDDAAVVPRSSNLPRRLVRNSSKQKHIRLTRTRPMRPETCDKHVVSWISLELKNYVFILLPLGEYRRARCEDSR